MKLNCRQGEIAIVVRSTSGNEGRVLTCLSLASREEVMEEGFMQGDWLGAVWKTDTRLADNWGYGTTLYPDARLRPIRDSEGEDEVLRLVGKPVGDLQAA